MSHIGQIRRLASGYGRRLSLSSLFTAVQQYRIKKPRLAGLQGGLFLMPCALAIRPTCVGRR